MAVAARRQDVTWASESIRQVGAFVFTEFIMLSDIRLELEAYVPSDSP